MSALKPPLALVSSPAPSVYPAQNCSNIRIRTILEHLLGPPYKTRSKTTPFSITSSSPTISSTSRSHQQDRTPSTLRNLTNVNGLNRRRIVRRVRAKMGDQ